MIRLSANLGFLWTELTLPEAIRAAARAGFAAVECHWPYETEAAEVRAALAETGLPMLGLNTRRGDVAAGDNGVAAIPGRENEARAWIDEALDYARRIDCPNVHVMAGRSDGGVAAEATFVRNLAHACDGAAAEGRTILIEPLNPRDAPGYHLATFDAARRTIDSVGRDNLRVMFDCYHLQITQGDVTTRLRDGLDRVGHVQIAAVPDRGEPDRGELDYRWVLAELDAMGWEGHVGAEYRPRGTTEAGLGWIGRVLPDAAS